jgi:hypothetical protein
VDRHIRRSENRARSARFSPSPSAQTAAAWSDVNASRLSPRWAPAAAAPQPTVVHAGTTGTRGNPEAQAEAAAQAPDVGFRSHGDLCWPQGGRANPRGKHDAPHH